MRVPGLSFLKYKLSPFLTVQLPFKALFFRDQGVLLKYSITYLPKNTKRSSRTFLGAGNV